MYIGGTSPHYTPQRYGESVLQQQIRQDDINRGYAIARAAEQRLAENRGPGHTLRDSIVRIINANSSESSPRGATITHQPTTRGMQQQPLMPAFTYEDIKDQIAGQDPLTAFKKYPQCIELAYQLFDDMAGQHLPAAFRKTPLSAVGKRLRMIMGAICKNVPPKDKSHLEYVIKWLARGGIRFQYDESTFNDTVLLLSSYGREPLQKFFETFEEHCRAAWKTQHPDHSPDVDDHDIFTSRAYGYTKALDFVLNDMTTDSHNDWMHFDALIYNFRELTVSLASSLKYNRNTDSPLDMTSALAEEANNEEKKAADPIELGITLDEDGNYVYTDCDKVSLCIGAACQMFFCCD